jgi:hypothetical protein
MAPVRVASVAATLLLALASGAAAQMTVGPAGAPGPGGFPGPSTSGPSPGAFPNQAPGGFPGAGAGFPGGGPGMMQGVLPGQSQGQAPPCMAEFVPLRTEAEKRAAALKAAATKRAPPKELCQLFTRFIESEAKVVKFMEKNAANCGIPSQVVSTTRTNHVKTNETKEKVCAAASDVTNEARRGPGLGDALGVRSVPTPDTTTTGAGTLDSLSGNPLKR